MGKKEFLINDEKLIKVKGGTNISGMIKFIPNSDFSNAIFGKDNNEYENASPNSNVILEKVDKNFENVLSNSIDPAMDSCVACKKPRKIIKK